MSISGQQWWQLWVYKKCRNNKSCLRMKPEVELGCISPVHELVQFWCVIVGKALGCQLSHYLENLEWEIVTKLSYLFVKYFESLWWKVLNICTLPCGLLNTHWSQSTRGNDMFSAGGDPTQTQDPHVSRPWRGSRAELRPSRKQNENHKPPCKPWSLQEKTGA